MSIERPIDFLIDYSFICMENVYNDIKYQRASFSSSCLVSIFIVLSSIVLVIRLNISFKNYKYKYIIVYIYYIYYINMITYFYNNKIRYIYILVYIYFIIFFYLLYIFSEIKSVLF